MWQSTSLVTARASVQALYAKEAEFLVTPKTAEEGSFWDAVRGNKGETFLALLGVAGIAAALTHPIGYAGPLTAVLLLWPTVSYAGAPVNSLAAQRAALPEDLRERRRTEFLRGGNARKVTAAVSGLALAGVATAIVVTLLAPGNVPAPSPRVLDPLRGHSSTPSPSSSPSGSSTPSSTSTSSATSSSTTAAPSPAASTPTSSATATSSPTSTSTASPTG